jgi:putative SOS response-associated peptidase YedK
MCYYKQDTALQQTLESYYGITLREPHHQIFYDNGFDHNDELIVTQDRPREFQNFSWGLIPWWTKTKEDALLIRIKTLNCVSEEMFDKASFKDSLIDGKRCLIPCTGFYEWRWSDSKGKTKYPYAVHLKDTELFSLAGVWSEWVDKPTGEILHTYSVLTTRANPLMEKIHNSKKRMPVILAKEYEKDWLNPNLTKDDVLALCQPFDTNRMEAHTISRMITDRKIDDKNIPEIAKPFEYPELALMDL